MEKNADLDVTDYANLESKELLKEIQRRLKVVAERERLIIEQKAESQNENIENNISLECSVNEENNVVLEEEETDKVIKAVKRAINDFAVSNESIVINNMTPEYVPIAVDKILELSNEVTIFDGTGDFLKEYNEHIQQKIDKFRKVTIYHTSLINFPKTDHSELIYISIKPETVHKLFGENIRNAIVGDKIRYRVEKSEERPSFKPFKNWFVSLFSSKIADNSQYTIQYKSLTNFFNRNEAEKILNSVEIAASTERKLVPVYK